MTEWFEDPETAAHYVLFVAEGGGKYKRPGSFAEQLVKTIFLADHSNRARLRRSFPVIVDAVVKYKDEETGHEELRRLALGT